jgi:DNA repair exonuclease SbcCD ATPase subunit
MGAIDTAKELVKLAQKLDNIEIVQKVIELQGELMELQERVQKLRDENRDLKKQLEAPAELIFQNDMYWRAAGPGNPGPFCSPCHDYKEKLVHMHGDNKEGYRCPACGKRIHTPQSRANEQAEFQKLQEQQDGLGPGW